MSYDLMEAMFERRNEGARISGVYDVRRKQDAKLAPRRLGEAIQFVALAPPECYVVRSAKVAFGEKRNEGLRANECARIWAKYGMSLLDRI
ncbi:hypothetical protein OHD62_00560 [Mesorhizobium sp. YC-39]|uniref:hypothetical protein n=1 Tax=unclassified Mesorhizobium TaxID=325217 RepID=UPI0021E823AF|nr:MULTISPECIES: hypothetical protein [unclassified Mesorhizobium]MCV3206749.1 hypothetical protein [Mesorhizobium sp. YC-2]MCV3226851.1 hypothetical protein [Mesorhizobium sp. YC-39]